MKSQLAEFIVAQTLSPQMSASFSIDPVRVMREARLSPEEQALVNRGNTEEMSQYIAKELGLSHDPGSHVDSQSVALEDVVDLAS